MKAFLVTFVFAALATINVVSACNNCVVEDLKVKTLEGEEYMIVRGAHKINITKDCDVVTSKKTSITFPECLTFHSVFVECRYKNGPVPVGKNATGCEQYNSQIRDNPDYEPYLLFAGLDNFVCENPCGNYSTHGKPYNLKDKETQMTAEGNGHHTCEITFLFDGRDKKVKLSLEATVKGCAPKKLFGK